MDHFLPPQFNLAMAWTADLLNPVVLKQYQNIQEIIISPEDRKTLRSLRDNRLMFFSNHPSQAEPIIAWHIANVMGSRFRYMATRRAFDFGMGLVGKMFQAVGAFSIIPGIADREAMRMARSILASPKGKLVLFPEGEPMCGENDSLMPFQSGIVKLGLAGLEDALKKDKSADITVLPGFVKYVIDAPKNIIEEDLRKSLLVLEETLGATPGERNLLRQFLLVGRLVLEHLEEEYEMKSEPDQDFEYRTGRVRHHMLDNIARKIGVMDKGFNKNADAITKLRYLNALMEMVDIGYEHPSVPTLTPAEKNWANRECVKAYDFITIKREYLVSYPSPERMYEWLARFESLLLGKTPRALGGEPSHLPRKAYMSFAKPFGLGEYRADYKKDKNKTLDVLLDRLRADMQQLLDEAMKRTSPIVAPYDIGHT